MSSYSRPQVPEIRIDGDDSFDTNKMLLGLATQIATKVISDSFYNQRKDKVVDDSRRMTNVVNSSIDAMKYSDPIQLQTAMDNMNAQLDGGTHPDGQPLDQDERNVILQNLTSLNQRYDMLTNARSRRKAELVGDVGYWEGTLSNIGTRNDAGYYDTELLEGHLSKLSDLIEGTKNSQGYQLGVYSDVQAYKTLLQIQSTLAQQHKMAEAVSGFQEKIREVGKQVDISKHDDKMFMKELPNYLKGLNDYVTEHSQFSKDLALDKLDDLKDTILMTAQGHHFDNFIDKLRADETFTNPESTTLLELADTMISEGMSSNDKGLIGKGINTVKTAITKEAIADRTAQLAEQKVQKAFADETLSGLSQAAGSLSSVDWGGTGGGVPSPAKVSDYMNQPK